MSPFLRASSRYALKAVSLAGVSQYRDLALGMLPLRVILCLIPLAGGSPGKVSLNTDGNALTIISSSLEGASVRVSLKWITSNVQLLQLVLPKSSCSFLLLVMRMNTCSCIRRCIVSG